MTAGRQRSSRSLGKEATFYDGMITGREKNTHYLEKALSGIPDRFSSKLLEVPLGTGVLTIPVYKTLPKAFDHVPIDPLEAAAKQMHGTGYEKVGPRGISKGVELALTSGSLLPGLDQRPIQTGLTPAIASASYTTYKIGTAGKSAVLFILPLTTNFVSDILIIRLSVI